VPAVVKPLRCCWWESSKIERAPIRRHIHDQLTGPDLPRRAETSHMLWSVRGPLSSPHQSRHATTLLLISLPRRLHMSIDIAAWLHFKVETSLTRSFRRFLAKSERPIRISHNAFYLATCNSLSSEKSLLLLGPPGGFSPEDDQERT